MWRKEVGEMTTNQLTHEGCQFYPYPVTRPGKSHKMSIAQIHALITDPQRYGQLTAQLRSMPTDKARKEFKSSKLDYVKFSGTFATPSDNGLIMHSNFICLDFDHLDARVPQVRQQLMADPCLTTALLFVSPSGNGLKWVVEIDIQQCSHRQWFYAIAEYVSQTYQLEADRSCVNESRNCFLCYDPEAYLNPAAFGSQSSSTSKSQQPMNTPTFNPIEWAAKSPINPDGMSHLLNQTPNQLLAQAQDIANQLEKLSADPAPDYNNWYKMGQALANDLGECGRSIFHQVSRLSPKYQQADCDKQYTACLKSHGEGLTIATYFHLAKQAGAQLKPFPPITPSVELVDLVELDTPQASDWAQKTFTDRIASKLSALMADIAHSGRNTQECDMLLFASLVVISSVLSNVMGRYDQRKVFPNIFGYVVAPPASSKGILLACTKLVEDIDSEIRNQSQAEHDQWEHDMTLYSVASKKNADAPKPKEPPYRSLTIPANGSATATYQALNDNHGSGLTFETEGDALGNSLKSDYGDYSEGLRSAAHHEPIKYNRRKENEHVYIKQPKWSVFITSTPDQLSRIFTSVDNGLFSRFLFLRIPRNLEWHDVFADQEQTLDEVMAALGKRVHALHHRLQALHEPIIFTLTKQQQKQFNQYFSQEQTDFFQMLGDDIVATIRRLGLSAFRIMMILSVTRLENCQQLPRTLECTDDDFQAAMAIIDVLMNHAAHVYADYILKAAPSDAHLMNLTPQEAAFYQALPQQFDRPTYQTIGQNHSNSPKRVDNLIGILFKKGVIERLSHGSYRKFSTQTKAN
ncbi:MAG: DUF3987 domain-containing protein [Bacteroidales bacterium]|nr:DUF3987 domain-containing protein [Bacteroidales bacterium]